MMQHYMYGFYGRALIAIDGKGKDEAIVRADSLKRLE